MFVWASIYNFYYSFNGYLWKKYMLLFAAIGAVEWLTMARIVRAQVIGLKNQEFVQVAQVMELVIFQCLEGIYFQIFLDQLPCMQPSQYLK